jgi:hypothetical protein
LPQHMDATLYHTWKFSPRVYHGTNARFPRFPTKDPAIPLISSWFTT